MQIDMFAGQTLAGIAQTATGGDRKPKGKFQAPRFMPQQDTGAAFIGPIDLRMVSRFRGGKIHHGKRVEFDTSGGELTKKRGGAIGMFEGWREVINEPVRQRVGLAGMQASYRVD